MKRSGFEVQSRGFCLRGRAAGRLLGCALLCSGLLSAGTLLSPKRNASSSARWA